MTQGGSHSDKPMDGELWVCGHRGGPFTGTLHQVQHIGRTEPGSCIQAGVLAPTNSCGTLHNGPSGSWVCSIAAQGGTWGGAFHTHGCLRPQPGQASGSSGPPCCWPRTQGGQARVAGIRECVLRRLEDRAEAVPRGLRA